MNMTATAERFIEYRNLNDYRQQSQPPCDSSRWNKTLLDIGGKCPLGDQRLRIVWGGIEKSDGFIQTEFRSVPAKVIKYRNRGIQRARLLKGFYYLKNGVHVFVPRADLIPQGCLNIPEYEYLELGLLRWILERKFTIEELVAAGIRPDPHSLAGKNYGKQGSRQYIAETNPRGEYVMMYALESPQGDYFEPDDVWFEGLRKTQFEIDNASDADKRDLLEAEKVHLEQSESNKKIAEMIGVFTDVEDNLIAAEKAPVNRVFSK